MPWTLDVAQDLEDGDRLLLIDPTPAIRIRASTNIEMELAIKANEKKDKKPWKETVPEYLHDLADVFKKQDFDELLHIDPGIMRLSWYLDQRTASTARSTPSVSWNKNSSTNS